MAVFNEIGIGRWNRFIQKLCDMKGGPPARQLSSEIAFSHPIFHGPENRYLESWDRFGHSLGNTGGAAQFAGHQFRNPAGSNIVAVIEKICCFGTGTADRIGVFIGAISADLTTVVSTTSDRIDARGRTAPALIVSSTTNFVAPAHFQLASAYSANSAVDLIFTDNQELQILPGDAIQVFDQVAALTMNAAVLWRERFLEPAERF